MYPADCKYTKDHEWIKVTGETGQVGITDYAQKQLGDVVYLDLPQVGRTLKVGESFGTVESVKAVSELYSPVAGVVTAVNSALAEKPERVNSDPHASWMIEIALANPGELDPLMGAEQSLGPGQVGPSQSPGWWCAAARRASGVGPPVHRGAWCVRCRRLPRQPAHPSVPPAPSAPVFVRAMRSSSMNPDNTGSFQSRHIGPRSHERDQMLAIIGSPSLDALMDEAIPSSIRLEEPPSALEPESEHAFLGRLRGVAHGNRPMRSLIGLGYSDCVTPSVILRNVLENPSWYTPYTPYQAEIAQGRLEALLTFQTLVEDLTGMPVANASLLDEPTAAAEAMTMLRRVQGGVEVGVHGVVRVFPADHRRPEGPGGAARDRAGHRRTGPDGVRRPHVRGAAADAR